MVAASTCPPRIAVRVWEPPSYGTPRNSVPVAIRTPSATRWVELPVPAKAQLNCPDFAFISAISSFMLLIGRIAVHDDDHGLVCQHGERIEFLPGERELPQVVAAQEGDGAEEDRVAVGSALLHLVVAHGAGGPHHVGHDDRLPQDRLQRLGQAACGQVARPPRRPGHHKVNGFAGVAGRRAAHRASPTRRRRPSSASSLQDLSHRVSSIGSCSRRVRTRPLCHHPSDVRITVHLVHLLTLLAGEESFPLIFFDFGHLFRTLQDLHGEVLGNH